MMMSSTRIPTPKEYLRAYIGSLASLLALLSPEILPHEGVTKATQNIIMDKQTKKWGQLISGLPINWQELCLSPLSMLKMRYLVKVKGVAPLAVPMEILMHSHEYPDITFAWYL